MPKCVVVCLVASLFECLLILPAHYLDFGSRGRAKDSLRAVLGGRLAQALNNSIIDARPPIRRERDAARQAISNGPDNLMPAISMRCPFE